MNVGIGLPAAVPDAEMSVIDPRSAPDASAGFDFVGVIDPLLNDNLDALAAAASTAWMSTVVSVCWRGNPVLLAKQLASVARLSAGRGARFETAIAAMEPSWRASGGRACVLLRGTLPTSFAPAPPG